MNSTQQASRIRQVLYLALIMTFQGLAMAASSSDENAVIQINNPPQTEKTTIKGGGGLISRTYDGFMETFSKDLSLNVVLGEVMILVILINIFALFKKPRLILATSYVFCLKWVFWSNYSVLLKQSDAISIISSAVFLLCGLLTIVFFCMNRFEKE